MDKVLVILGPTSTGKTDLALDLAKKFNGELVSCDSRQVYVGLDVGTGKLPSGRWNMDDGRWKKGKGFWILDGVKIWMYDVVNPRKQYTVADYVKDVKKVIGKIRKKGKLPIIVGGTGFYLRALLEGLSNLEVPLNQVLRERLEKLSASQLEERLKKLAPTRWESMNNSDKQNPRRLSRAIELGVDKEDKGNKGNLGNQGLTKEFNILKVGLIAPREFLYKKINDRVISRINQGMIDEANSLCINGLSLKRMRQLGLEYGVLADYLEGKIREIQGDQGLIKIIQNKIHGYVRRQITWFKKEKDVFWFDITQKNFSNQVEKLITKWYYQNDAT